MRRLKGMDILRKFNREKLTLMNFRQLCRLNNVEIIFNDDTLTGMYYFTGNRHTIVISSMLEKDEEEFTLWHEFGHFLQNFREPKIMAAFSKRTVEDHRERLADVFAGIASGQKQVKLASPEKFLEMLMGIK